MMNFYDKADSIDLKNLRLGALRYFSKENNGVELTDALAYVILEEGKNPKYLNIFNMTDDLPIFERLPYSNILSSGEEFGSKLVVVQGEENLESGPCYVLCKDDLCSFFGKDRVTALELEEFILNSKYYFLDRKSLALQRIKKHPLKMTRILANDLKKEEKVNSFFVERGVQLQKVR